MLWPFSRKKKSENFSPKKEAPTSSSKKDGKSSCVIIGSVGSGKTALLASLEQCALLKSHSYAKDFEVNILPAKGKEGDHYRKVFVDGLDSMLEDGLNISATLIENISYPNFKLELKEKNLNNKYAPNIIVHFSTFDGAGGLLLSTEDEVKSSFDSFEKEKIDTILKNFKEGSNTLHKKIEESNNILLCIPIIGIWEGSKEKIRLAEYLNDFKNENLSSGNKKKLIICFTMYEKIGMNDTNKAYYLLHNREKAKEHMNNAISNMKWLQSILYVFPDSSNVYFTPISSYGFIVGTGESNYDKKENRLLTCPENGLFTLADVKNDYWQPFLTIDPFIFISTGNRQNTLIHSLKEIRT